MVFEKGQPPWNKGLTKETNEIMEIISEKVKGNQNWLGRNHTEETKQKMRDYSKEHPEHHFIKNQRPWNYKDGRSIFLSPARYGEDWPKIRWEVYQRDNFTCQECGLVMKDSKYPHHVHHKIPFLDGGSNELDNLITLCKSCHSKIEVRKKKVEV